MSAGIDTAGKGGAPAAARLAKAAPSKPALFLVLLGFAAIYLIWGSTYLGIRVAVGTMPPYLLAGLRFAIAGVALFGFLKLRGAPWPNRAQWKD